VDDVEAHLELGVLVLEGVVAVGGGDEYLLHARVDEGLYVLPRELLEEVLVARLAYGLPAAHLLLAEDAEADVRLLQDLRRRLGDLLQPGVVAAVAAGEVEVLHPLLEGLDAEPVGPGRAGLPVLVEGVALTGEPGGHGAVGLDGAGEDAVARRHPADGNHVVDLPDVTGAALGALAAGGAAPDLLFLDLAYAEGGLADQLPHGELAHLVPGTDGVALAALVAVLYRVSAFLLYLVYYLFERGYDFHGN